MLAIVHVLRWFFDLFEECHGLVGLRVEFRLRGSDEGSGCDRLLAPAFLRCVALERVHLAEAGGVPWNFLRSPEHAHSGEVEALVAVLGN